jgi:hypothetical protein
MQNSIATLLAESPPHRCLLLVHPTIDVLEKAADEFEASYGWPRLSVGRELAAALLPAPPSQRPRLAQRWMEDRLGQMAPGPVLCTEIDLLFHPDLKLDPLTLLRHASRITRVVATWPGSYLDGVLSYAVPQHAHYRVFRQPEALILALE